MRVEHLTDPGHGPVIKRLTSRELGEPEAWARLAREGDILEALGGRVTPRVRARGQDARGPFVELERIPFPTLAEHLERAAGPLDAAFVARVLRAALEALAVVHEHELGVVHGDVAPANLVVWPDGARVVLLDFDLALTRTSPDPDGAFRGTLRYAAPEVARGERPDTRSDLFGLGATMLHAVTGHAPRGATSFPALLAEVAEEPILTEQAAQALAATSPAGAALVACLAHERTQRPPSARAVLARL